jgi:hypothetical protein
VTRCAGEGQIHQPQSAWQSRSRRRLSPFPNHARVRGYSISPAIRVPVVHASQILRRTKVANQLRVVSRTHTVTSGAKLPSRSGPGKSLSLLVRHNSVLLHVNKQICGNYATRTHGKLPRDFKFICLTPSCYLWMYTSTTTSSADYLNSSSTTLPCAATTRHPAAQALRQPRRAPRVLVS